MTEDDIDSRESARTLVLAYTFAFQIIAEPQKNREFVRPQIKRQLHLDLALPFCQTVGGDRLESLPNLYLPATVRDTISRRLLSPLLFLGAVK